MMGVRWTLRHQSGHEESDVAEVPIDDKGMKGNANKTQTHAFGSTASYARRYLFCMIFDVATSDDNDGNSHAAHATVSAEQFIELRDLIAETDTDFDRFVLAFGGKPGEATLEEFPAASFDKAKQMLLRKKQEAK